MLCHTIGALWQLTQAVQVMSSSARGIRHGPGRRNDEQPHQDHMFGPSSGLKEHRTITMTQSTDSTIQSDEMPNVPVWPDCCWINSTEWHRGLV